MDTDSCCLPWMTNGLPYELPSLLKTGMEGKKNVEFLSLVSCPS